MEFYQYELRSKIGKIVLRHYVPQMNLNINFPTILLLTGDSPKGFGGYSCQRLLPILLNSGFGVVVFDFHGLGISDGERKNLTLTVGIKDFKQVCEKFFKLPYIDFNRTILFATSYGASVVLATPKYVNRFKRVILRSPVAFLPEAYINEIGVNNYDVWEKNKYSDLNGYTFEVLMDPLKYNLYSSSKKISIQCVIIYGEKDEVVSTVQTKLLHSMLQCDKKIFCIKDANHGYSIGDSFNQMIEVLLKSLVDLK